MPFANLYGRGGVCHASTVNTTMPRQTAAAGSGRSLSRQSATTVSMLSATASTRRASRSAVGGVRDDGFACSLSNYGACLLVTAPDANTSRRNCPRCGIRPHRLLSTPTDNAAFPPHGYSTVRRHLGHAAGLRRRRADARRQSRSRLARRAEHHRGVGDAHRQRDRRREPGHEREQQLVPQRCRQLERRRHAFLQRLRLRRAQRLQRRAHGRGVVAVRAGADQRQ